MPTLPLHVTIYACSQLSKNQSDVMFVISALKILRQLISNQTLMDFEIEYFFFLVAYLATKHHQVGTIFVLVIFFFGGGGGICIQIVSKDYQQTIKTETKLETGKCVCIYRQAKRRKHRSPCTHSVKLGFIGETVGKDCEHILHCMPNMDNVSKTFLHIDPAPLLSKTKTPRFFY